MLVPAILFKEQIITEFQLQQKYNYNFEVNEANLNECTDIYLGGYLE